MAFKHKSILLWLTTTSLLSFLTGCLTPQICRLDKTRQAGYQQAEDGQKLDYTVVDACKLNKPIVYQSVLERGYNEGRKEICDPIDLFEIGEEQGEEKAEKSFPETPYTICLNLTDLKLAFENGYKQGQKSHCNPEETKEEAYAMFFRRTLFPFLGCMFSSHDLMPEDR